MQHFQQYYTYILASKKRGTLYIGVTNNLERRIEEYKIKLNPDCFTAKYDVINLVYFEIFQFIDKAILREKQLKNGIASGRLI